MTRTALAVTAAVLTGALVMWLTGPGRDAPPPGVTGPAVPLPTASGVETEAAATPNSAPHPLDPVVDLGMRPVEPYSSELAEAYGEGAALDQWDPELPDGEDTLTWWLRSVGRIWIPGDIPELPDADTLIRLWSDPAQTNLDPETHQDLVEQGRQLATVAFTAGDTTMFPTYWAESDTPPRSGEELQDLSYRGFEVVAVQAGAAEVPGWAWVGVVWQATYDPYRNFGPVDVDMETYLFEQLPDGDWAPRPCWQKPAGIDDACFPGLGIPD